VRYIERMKTYRFMEPARACYGQKPGRNAIEEIIRPSFARNQFETDQEANDYAQQVFGEHAFALPVEGK
jgi:hypothetical protein